jgi:ferrous iron transport protein B
MTTRQLKVALAGNPNAGKSTIFNALTGERQHVGNWPGKTVEKKEGMFSIDGETLHVVDLPGIYSLTAYSIEEIVTRDYLIHEHPDVVVAVVDAANLERNLYLVVQLIELGAPLLVVLNMADVAEARGLKIDEQKLAARLRVPVISTIATQRRGLTQLKALILETAYRSRHDDDPHTALH